MNFLLTQTHIAIIAILAAIVAVGIAEAVYLIVLRKKRRESPPSADEKDEAPPHGAPTESAADAEETPDGGKDEWDGSDS